MRAVLIRDTNKMIAAAVLSSPKVSDSEIESFARMANVGEDVLRIIGNNRQWTKHYGVVVGLTKNPKTPVAVSMNLMGRLSARDLMTLAIDRNVPDALRSAGTAAGVYRRRAEVSGSLSAFAPALHRLRPRPVLAHARAPPYYRRPFALFRGRSTSGRSSALARSSSIVTAWAWSHSRLISASF